MVEKKHTQVIRFFKNHLSIKRQSLTAKCPQTSGRGAAEMWASACPSKTQKKGGKVRRERREDTVVNRIAIRATILNRLL